jgi:hypothetical protein
MESEDSDVGWRCRLRVSEREEFVAERVRRESPNANGHIFEVRIRHTRDGGASWEQIPWRKNWFSPGAYLIDWWPPSDKVQMEMWEGRLRIAYEDEEGLPMLSRATYDPRQQRWWIQVPWPDT